ncbi:MAG: CRISPR-associated protein (Cas_GSU0053) [Acidobacteria bacterium ADurb.Bin051]|jgi:CRISPR-associated protein Csb1|nr:type I-U CRISPR-associated RAMP protein Csb1/Cas7u [Acidobacteriota bacterium]OQC39798.1 MAG: CRISPR-associated protein (Cas_GSU0053) [Acidobacteria bacterium ADurb.Bin051]
MAPGTLTLQTIEAALAGQAAAFRATTDYQPAGGQGDKVFPPTYEDGKYAVETRLIGNEEVSAVLLDSVQSQANRMEIALREAWEEGDLPLPVISVDFAELAGKVTSLDAPHRIADAILRDSLLADTPFRETDAGKALAAASVRNATGLFGVAPSALLFGLWDSTGPKGGMGAKFQRAIVSEIVGLHAITGKKTSSRIDPLQIQIKAGTLYEADNAFGWTLEESEARRTEKKEPKKLGEKGRPSEANHGNITPTTTDGGVTISKAQQITVLSLIALRRLRFPLNGKTDPQVELAARTVLAALGLFAATRIREQGADLRSRCVLFATGAPEWELLAAPGATPEVFAPSSRDLLDIVRSAVARARELGLPWQSEELVLQPSDGLRNLVYRSQQLSSTGD